MSELVLRTLAGHFLGFNFRFIGCNTATRTTAALHCLLNGGADSSTVATMFHGGVVFI